MDKYRVIVLREGTEADETLFEIAGPAALVQHIVPGVLDTVLADGEAGSLTFTATPGLADRVFDGAVAAGAAAEQQATGPAGETAEQAGKRKRRTKAEIAADKEAQGLGFRDAAHRAEVEARQDAAPVEQAFPGAVATPYSPPAGEVVAGSVPGPVVTEPAPAAVAPPYNPFAQ